MPWPLRDCRPDSTYHCYSRCIELRDLLSPDYVKELAVEAINQALAKYDFELVHLEFVENHFHIIIKTTAMGETISRIMQYIKARITEKYNKMMGRTGTFWNERFKCKIIEDAEDPVRYFLWLLWYIAYNPVRKRIIGDPRESEYGTIRVYLEIDYKPRVTVAMHKYFFSIGRNFKERVDVLLRYEDLYRQKLSELYF